MDFDKLLQTLEGTGTEKTASAPESKGPDKALQEALRQTLDKTASATAAPTQSNPIDDLEKLAEDLASTEKDAEVIHAASMGRAFADAAIEQFAAADAKVAQVQAQQPALAPMAVAEGPAPGDVDNAMKLAAEIGYSDAQNAVAETAFQEKIASATPQEADELIKMAQQVGREDLLVKAAADQGYRDTQEKVAAVQYAQGENDALEEIHKVASDEFIKGAQEANILVDKARHAQQA